MRRFHMDSCPTNQAVTPQSADTGSRCLGHREESYCLMNCTPVMVCKNLIARPSPTRYQRTFFPDGSTVCSHSSHSLERNKKIRLRKASTELSPCPWRNGKQENPCPVLLNLTEPAVPSPPTGEAARRGAGRGAAQRLLTPCPVLKLGRPLAPQAHVEGLLVAGPTTAVTSLDPQRKLQSCISICCQVHTKHHLFFKKTQHVQAFGPGAG